MNDPFEQLVAECFDRIDSEGMSVVEELCDSNPEHAAELRAYVTAMFGLDAQQPPPTVAVQSKIGDYEILSVLGRGGMGVVYLARDHQLGRDVAIKTMRSNLSWDDTAKKRFRREAEAVAKLQHPGIIGIHEVNDHEGLPYIVMERLEGSSLLELIHRIDSPPDHQKNLSGIIPELLRPRLETHHKLGHGEYERSILWIFVEVAGALQHAHERGLIHRDIKPSNIMITTSGRVVLLDFGLAIIDGSDSRLTETGHTPGSLPYMAPERLSQSQTANESLGDVYSLGVSLFEALSLKHPFALGKVENIRRRIMTGVTHNLRKLNPQISWESATVCQKAMDLAPERRYQSIAEFCQDLNRILGLRPIQARRPGLVLRSKRWVQRSPARAVAVLLSFILVFVTPTLLAIQARNSEKAVVAQRDLYLRQKTAAENSRQQAQGEASFARGSERFVRSIIENSVGWSWLEEEDNRFHLKSEVNRILAEYEPGSLLRGRLAQAISRLLLPMKQLDLAQDLITKAHAIAERHENQAFRSEVYATQSDLDFANGSYASALANTHLALEHSSTAALHRRLGAILDKLEKFDEAKAAYRRAKELSESTNRKPR